MLLVYQAASVLRAPLIEPSFLSKTDPRDLSKPALDLVLGAPGHFARSHEVKLRTDLLITDLEPASTNSRPNQTMSGPSNG